MEHLWSRTCFFWVAGKEFNDYGHIVNRLSLLHERNRSYVLLPTESRRSIGDSARIRKKGRSPKLRFTCNWVPKKRWGREFHALWLQEAGNHPPRDLQTFPSEREVRRLCPRLKPRADVKKT